MPTLGERRLEKGSLTPVVEADSEMNDKQLQHRKTTGAIHDPDLGRFLLQQRDNVVGITNPGIDRVIWWSS